MKVQIGCLYISYRSSSIKNEAEKCKSFNTDYISLLFYCYVHSISSGNPSQNWEHQMWNFDFVYLRASFHSFLQMHNLKLYCVRKLCTPNDCSTTGHLPFPVWSDVRGTTGELWPQNCPQGSITFTFRHLWGFRCGMHSQAIPGLLNVCVIHYNELTHNQLWVRRSSTIVFPICLVLNTNLLQQKMPLCIWTPLDLHSMIVPICIGEYLWLLPIISTEVLFWRRWKLAVCIWLKFKHVSFQHVCLKL